MKKDKLTLTFSKRDFPILRKSLAAYRMQTLLDMWIAKSGKTKTELSKQITKIDRMIKKVTE